MSTFVCYNCGARDEFALVLKLGMDYNDRNDETFREWGISNHAAFDGQARKYPVVSIVEGRHGAEPVFATLRGQPATSGSPDTEEDGIYNPLWYCTACGMPAVDLADLVRYWPLERTDR